MTRLWSTCTEEYSCKCKNTSALTDTVSDIYFEAQSWDRNEPGKWSCDFSSEVRQNHTVVVHSLQFNGKTELHKQWCCDSRFCSSVVKHRKHAHNDAVTHILQLSGETEQYRQWCCDTTLRSSIVKQNNTSNEFVTQHSAVQWWNGTIPAMTLSHNTLQFNVRQKHTGNEDVIHILQFHGEREQYRLWSCDVIFCS